MVIAVFGLALGSVIYFLLAMVVTDAAVSSVRDIAGECAVAFVFAAAASAVGVGMVNVVRFARSRS